MNQTWGKMPGWAKFLAIFMSAVMLTLSVSNREALLSTVTGSGGAVVEPVAADTVEVEFLVYSEDGNNPINRARVQFIFDGAPEPRLTNSDGFVKIEVPRRDDINVVVKKEGFKDLTRTINLLADEETTVPYFLETDEAFSSYNLRGSNMPEGLRLGMSSITIMTLETLGGDPINSSVQNPFVTHQFTKDSNEEAEYEFTEVKDGQPTQIIKKVEKEKSSVTGIMRFVAKDDNKSYEYDKALSEAGAFEGRKILSQKDDGQWLHKLASGRPTDRQKTELAGSRDIYEGISYNYPREPVKVGHSWDFDSVLEMTDTTVTNSNITATLSEITDYEGEKVALITIAGNANATEIDSGESSQEDSSGDRKSMVSQLSDFFYDSLLKDISLDYAMPAVIQQVSEDLFYDEFTLSDKLENNSPKAYNKLIEVYQEVSNEEDFGDFTLPTIKAIVKRKVNEKEIPYLFAESTSGWLADDIQELENDVSNGKVMYDLSVEGRIYRSLKYPIDLSIDLDLAAKVKYPDSAERRGSRQNMTTNYKIKYSVI